MYDRLGCRVDHLERAVRFDPFSSDVQFGFHGYSLARSPIKDHQAECSIRGFLEQQNHIDLAGTVNTQRHRLFDVGTFARAGVHAPGSGKLGHGKFQVPILEIRHELIGPHDNDVMVRQQRGEPTPM